MTREILLYHLCYNRLIEISKSRIKSESNKRIQNEKSFALFFYAKQAFYLETRKNHNVISLFSVKAQFFYHVFVLELNFYKKNELDNF